MSFIQLSNPNQITDVIDFLKAFSSEYTVENRCVDIISSTHLERVFVTHRFLANSIDPNGSIIANRRAAGKKEFRVTYLVIQFNDDFLSETDCHTDIYSKSVNTEHGQRNYWFFENVFMQECLIHDCNRA